MSAVEARLAAVEARLAAIEARIAGGSGGSDGRPVASDDDLDSEWGDEVIKKDPKRWIDQGGESYEGCKMSECPSAYLNSLASLFDWQADKDEEKGATYVNKKTGKAQPTAPFKRKSAARARGWAKRNAGKTAAPPPKPQHEPSGGGQQDDFAGYGGASDDDIPFAFDATIHGRWDRP